MRRFLSLTLAVPRVFALFVALALVVTASVAAATPLTSLRYRVHAEDAERREAAFLAQDVRKLLATTGKPATVKVVDGGTLTVAFAHPADASVLDRAHVEALGKDVVEAQRRGGVVTLVVNADYRERVRQAALQETEALAARRLAGIPGATVHVDAAASQLVVDLPPAAEVAAVAARLERPVHSQLCFADHADPTLRRLLDDKAAAAAGLRIAERTWLLDGHDERERFFEADDEPTLRRGLAMLTARAPLPATQRWVIGPSDVHVRAYLCSTHDAIDGAHLVEVSHEIDPKSRVAQVVLAFDAATAPQLLALSKAARGKWLLVTRDDWAESATLVDAPIPGGRARIDLGAATPDDARASAFALFYRLRPGALPLERL